ncbi:hypothetical protein K458DRAFT_190280 [Lentithecium fluviatile CBS 122367]|uniref:Uncharacterized protein n=1 Tax=Lentithecium fluviatile CBS 122367 TaxID=1168545 RepID=A0A6G1JB99_9PLEO|nr:hypothetical protein K458DRAFT_190280 [Lentithecium fluviatile CBS 122367]
MEAGSRRVCRSRCPIPNWLASLSLVVSSSSPAVGQLYLMQHQKSLQLSSRDLLTLTHPQTHSLGFHRHHYRSSVHVERGAMDCLANDGLFTTLLGPTSVCRLLKPR